MAVQRSMEVTSSDSSSTISGGDQEVSAESDPGPSGSSTTVTSLLSRLKAPPVSELSRKRRVHTNPPPKGKRRSSGRGFCDPKGVEPRQRVSEYTGEELTVSAGKLSCRACRECVGTKRSIVSNHVKSAKHAEGKKRLSRKEATEVDIAAAMKQHDSSTHDKGETVPEEQRVYRARVMKAFLRAGVPLSKLTHFRELLEEGGHRLTDTRHMLDMIRFILVQERDQVKKEIEGKYLSVIFDGTSRLGEVLAVVLRFVDDDFVIQQRLVRLMFLLKSLTGEETARELITVLSVSLSIPPEFLLGAMRDGASVNSVAMRTVSIVYSKVLDIGCVSHTLTLVGGRFSTPMLSSFVSELAAVVDCGLPIVKATYRLEGDGPLIFQAYEELSTVREAIQSAHYPNLQAVIVQKIAGGNATSQQRLLTYASSCLRPGIQYFEAKLGSDLSPPVSVFTAARLFSPSKVDEMKPVATDVDSLSVFPFLNDAGTLSNLKSELPSYLAKASDVSLNFDVLEWWKHNSDNLPYWAAAARKVLSLQPSSAAAERDFSLLTNSFSCRQSRLWRTTSRLLLCCSTISTNSSWSSVTVGLSLKMCVVSVDVWTWE